MSGLRFSDAIGLWTLYAREVRRFLKVYNQTILAPMVTTIEHTPTRAPRNHRARDFGGLTLRDTTAGSTSSGRRVGPAEHE